MASAFANAIEFLGVIGLFDIILPFILSFVLMYAILDKTKVLGTIKEGDREYGKQNLNSLVAFCSAFLVVASAELVSIINQSIGKIVILIMISVFYLVTIGTFFSKGEEVFLDKGPWRTGFMVANLIAILLIFASSIPTGNGSTWLEWIYEQVVYNINSPAVSSSILIIFIIVVMFFITSEPKKGNSDKGGSKE
jgi:hypothetical protein